MAVHPAAEPGLGVVEVRAGQVAQAHHLLELPHGTLVRRGGGEIVAGGVQVAGVQAHADARLVFDAVDQAGELREGAAQVAALAGGAFVDRGHLGNFGDGPIEKRGDLVHARRIVHLAEVTAGVKVQAA